MNAMYVEGHPDADEIDRLFRFLTRPGPRFGLAVAIFADWVLAAAARKQLNRQLREEGREPAATLELHYDSEQPQDLVQRIIDGSQGSEGLFVVGLDRFVVDEYGKPRPTSSIANLNQRRDHLPELLDTRVVFWMPKSAWPALTEFAWDLCQVFMTTAELDAVREVEVDAVRAGMRPEWLQLAASDEVPQLEQQLEALVRVHETASTSRAAGDAAASVAEMEIRLGHIASARTWVERASHEHEQAGQLDEAARWARRAAEMALFAGELDDARTHAQRARDLARQGGHMREEALALALLAEHDARHGEVERAIAKLEDDVLPTLERMGDDAAQAEVLGKLADFREMRGENEEALALREQHIVPLHARVRGSSGPSPAAQQANVTRMAESYVRKGKLEQAQQLTLSAPSREATNTLALIAQARGDVDTAATLRERASTASEDDPAARARALGGRAEQLAGAGQLAEALRVRQDEELPIYEQLEDLRAQVVTLGEIADLLSALGRTDEAIDTLEHRMRPLARRLGDAWLLNRASDKLLALLRSREEPEAQAMKSMVGSGGSVVSGTKTAPIRVEARRTSVRLLIAMLGSAAVGAGVVAAILPWESGIEEPAHGDLPQKTASGTPETAPVAASEIPACEVLTRDGPSKLLAQLRADERREVGPHTIACTKAGMGQRAVIELPSDALHVFEWPPVGGLSCTNQAACRQLELGCEQMFVCSQPGDFGCTRGRCVPSPTTVIGDCDFDRPPTRIGAPTGKLDDPGSGMYCGVVETALEDTIMPMQLIGLSGGEFTMGSDKDDEAPRHRVAVSRFAICETEVSVTQYEAVTGARPSSCRIGCRGEDPVHGVSWEDAARFMNALTARENARRSGAPLTPCYDETTWTWDRACTGYRLPTEAEWEFAARAGTSTDYSYGNGVGELCEHGHVGGCPGDREVVSVTARRPNPWNLFGMHGNVWEWVHDVYDEDFYARSPAVDPDNEIAPGRAPGDVRRSMRGCSFNSSHAYCRSANRDQQIASRRDQVYGFRCAKGARANP